MKAWERANDLFRTAKPVILNQEDQTWEANKSFIKTQDQGLALNWASNVPGSGAPEKTMVAAVQAMENRGYRVSEKGYALLEEGLKVYEDKDFVRLHKITAALWHEITRAQKDEKSDYWNYTYYKSFEEYEKKVVFPKPEPVDTQSLDFKDKIKAAWLSQMIGAAMGTMVEGYTSENLFEAFGNVETYVREPNTYNDDITYEIAFLDAFREYGYDVTSADIALSWAGLIPCGWSAEEIALQNIKQGIMPPESGIFRNPFNEWIGAQMKGGIIGMVCPGDAYMAAKLAWADGEVAHAGNGILGEVFNGVLTSLAFTGRSLEDMVKDAIEMIPKDSEYYSVVSFAYNKCREESDWKEALRACCEKYKTYNWIHAYPNACCEIIALLYGGGDFKKTLNIITMCGIDADCNAGMIMPVLAIQKGMCIIPKDLLHPAFEELTTYMRGYERMTLDELVDDTLSSIHNSRRKKL